MKSNQSKIIESVSSINYPYKTIKITQSRIDKGLVAIPVSLAIEWFRNCNTIIKVQYGDTHLLQIMC